MCQHNLPCSIVYAHCLLAGRAFASLYVLLFLEKEAEIGGRVAVFTHRGDQDPAVVFELLATWKCQVDGRVISKQSGFVW